jgi:hypothetical protein
MKNLNKQADGYCEVRKDLLKKGLAVSIGDKYCSTSQKLQYRWSEDDTVFQVLYCGEWQDAESIDFNFK